MKYDEDNNQYWIYEYDVNNRLTRVVFSADGTIDTSDDVRGIYFYDASGLRIKKIEGDNVDSAYGIVDGKTTVYIYNGQSILFEETFDTVDQNELDNPANFDVRELNISLNGNIAKIKMEYNSGSGSWSDVEVHYHLLDHLGSRQKTYKQGLEGSIEAVANITYETFGSATGTPEEERSYTGKKMDGETGLYYFNARYYDPVIGRFITVDPIKDGVNWYVYCENNPLKYVDPTGLINVCFLPGTPFSVSDKKDQTMIFLAINEARGIANANIEYFNNKISSNDNKANLAIARQIRDSFQAVIDFLNSDRTLIILQKDFGANILGEGSLGPNLFFEVIWVSSNEGALLANTNLSNLSELALNMLHELLHNIGKDHKKGDDYWDSPYTLEVAKNMYSYYIESKLFHYNDYNNSWYAPSNWYKGMGGHGT